MIRLYLTQIVHSNSKRLFLLPYNCLSKFLWCTAPVSLFFASRKNSLFRTGRQVTCQMFISKVFKDLVEKIISPVIFDTNCLFKQ